MGREGRCDWNSASRKPAPKSRAEMSVRERAQHARDDRHASPSRVTTRDAHRPLFPSVWPERAQHREAADQQRERAHDTAERIMSTAPPTRAPLRRLASINGAGREDHQHRVQDGQQGQVVEEVARLANDAGRGPRGIATLAKRSMRDAASSRIRLPSGVSSSWRCPATAPRRAPAENPRGRGRRAPRSAGGWCRWWWLGPARHRTSRRSCWPDRAARRTRRN